MKKFLPSSIFLFPSNFMRSFEEIEVWRISRTLVKEIYNHFSSCKDYGFKDQICRAAISIMNNIAEGHERASTKEFIRFLVISKGSCGEVRSMLIVAPDLNYIDINKAQKLIEQCRSISKQLSGFIKYLEKTL
ncbi:four helix bundle protein [Roseimarinus sediminis]|uniref:four helix bundle protein n=1 Tax=Roseimarinus sediminis TaxID=1610899 RepID=UPI003D23A219